MKLNSIHEELLSLYPDQTNLRSIHGFCFSPEDYIERSIDIFKRGYWHMVPFAFNGHFNYAVRLIPKLSIKESPVCHFNNLDPVTLAPEFKSFIPFFSLQYFDDKEIIEEDIRDEWQKFSELANPFLSYVDSPNSLEFMEEFVFDSKNIDLLNGENGYANIFRKFWNEYYDTDQQKNYDQILDKLINDRSYLPEISTLDCGIWNNRISNAVANKAHSQLKKDFNIKQQQFWHYLTQPHGIDSINNLIILNFIW